MIRAERILSNHASAQITNNESQITRKPLVRGAFDYGLFFTGVLETAFLGAAVFLTAVPFLGAAVLEAEVLRAAGLDILTGSVFS